MNQIVVKLGGVGLKVNFFIDENQSEYVDFHVKEITPELQMIADELQKHSVPLWGYQEKTVTPLLPEKIIRVYTETSEVFVETTAGIYQAKLRIYQFAEVLPKDFIQISSGEIVNFNYIDHLELSGNGNIKLIFQSQEESFVSRRYVARIKRRLGI